MGDGKLYGYSEVEVIGISVRPVIYPSTMFLTEKAAREHLQRNDYHYSGDAHTYCMCSWRSPDVERLWKILREIRWEGVRRPEVDLYPAQMKLRFEKEA